MSLAERIQDLSNLSTAIGLLMKSPTNPDSFIPIKLTLQPYLIRKSKYQEIGEISKVWQKLLYLASKDTELIKRTFEQVSHVDDLIKNVYRIFLKTSSISTNDSLLITRVDYFKNTNEEFKIIEYNVTATSMHAHSQNFLKAQKILQFQEERNPENQYPDNTPCTDMVDAIEELYRLKGMNGLFLMVVSQKEKNVVDQTTIQLKLMERGIKSKRQSLCRLSEKIHKQQNKLFYENQQISVVYFRAGYQPRDYCQNGNTQKCWQTREIIELSDTIKIPDVRMQLMNQKRMQVQLSKESVHEKYLTQEECQVLRRSLVFTVDFQQNNPQSIDPIKYIQEKGTDKFILKPNLQGGGNNIYGLKAYQTLKTLNEEQRKKYIMMEKIVTSPVEKTMFYGPEYKTLQCICEVSRYGILMEVDGKLHKNQSEGYLIRVKPETADQGGVMAGVGSIAVVAFESQQ